MSRTVSNLLIVAGGVGLGGAVLWWHTFFTEVFRFMGTQGPLPTECIYTLSGPCSLITGVANAVGAVAYDPKLFWGSAAAVVIGGILRLLPDGSPTNASGPRRKDPLL